MSVFNFFSNFLEPFSYLLCLIAIFIYHRKTGSWVASLLSFYYLSLTTLLTIASFHIGKNSKSNIWSYDLSALISTFCIGIFFYQLYTSRIKKKVVIGAISAYLLYIIYHNVTLTSIRLFDSVGYSILSASVALYVFMYFQQVLKNVSEKSILSQFNFWLASSYLLYYVGSFLIFLTYYYLTAKVINTMTKEQSRLLTALWGMHNVLLFVSALALLTGSIWLTYRRKSS